MRRQTGRTRLREKASGSAVIRTMYRAAATAAWTGSKENGRDRGGMVQWLKR